MACPGLVALLLIIHCRSCKISHNNVTIHIDTCITSERSSLVPCGMTVLDCGLELLSASLVLAQMAMCESTTGFATIHKQSTSVTNERFEWINFLLFILIFNYGVMTWRKSVEQMFVDNKVVPEFRFTMPQEEVLHWGCWGLRIGLGFEDLGNFGTLFWYYMGFWELFSVCLEDMI